MFKILVVEDDKDLNQTVCAYLNRNGYEAIGCLNAFHQHTALFLCQGDQFPGLSLRKGHRLLTKHMLSMLQK